MSHAEHVRTRLHVIDKRLARLRAQKDRLIARANKTARTRDTRRKIIIGGAVLAALEHEGVPRLSSQLELLQWLETQLQRPADRAVFELDSRRSA